MPGKKPRRQIPKKPQARKISSGFYPSSIRQIVHSDLPRQHKTLERSQQRRQREVQSRFLNIMFARIPIFDPDAFSTLLAVDTPLYSPIGACFGW